jgi:hypothetical protein
MILNYGRHYKPEFAAKKSLVLTERYWNRGICMSISATTVRRLFSAQISPLPHIARTLPAVKNTPAIRPSTFSAQVVFRRMASTAQPDREVLPSSVVPKHYHLSLTPNFETFKYAGAVNVTLDIEKPTSKIVLNALELELHSAEVKTKAGVLKATGISVDEEKQEATLEFGEELKAGKEAAQLRIEFTGVLNDKMAGFYRSSYIDVKSGEKKWLATTQMGTLQSPE